MRCNVNIKKNQYEKNKDKQAKQHQTYVLHMILNTYIGRKSYHSTTG